MVTLMALYRRPSDEAGFLSYYEQVHVPLALKMPGMLSLSHGRVSRDLTGDGSVFYMAIMTFPDHPTLEQALTSPEGQAASRDVSHFAAGLLTLVAGETMEESTGDRKGEGSHA